MARRLLTVVIAPVLALILGLAITLVIVMASGGSASAFLATVFTAPDARNIVNILNNGSVLYLSALAAAIGFKMGLLNIGVEGQYRIGVFFAAVFASQGWLPGPLNILVSILLAVLVGALWAAIAGALKVTRGVSEVISTIMLNAIAISITSYLLRKWGVIVGNNLATETIPEGSWVPGLFGSSVYGLLLLAVLVGILYSVVLSRSRFGFELRATGASPTAAIASGINVRRMVVVSMLLSGGVAGLVGLPILFGSTHSFSTTFQAGLGFTGIAVALLGRNHPVGIAVAAVLFAYLTEQGAALEVQAGVSNELVAVTQGVIVLCVVVAYEVVRRYRAAQEQREVAAELSEVEAAR